ncbi:ankyrin repeat domain-containing protein [Anatilimnocola floriformis]|uniref:ankyrin repeat domain-containing protein n=1 Tax=Anatilimnocola floriformis TaxID=2948575 RepID=UPI0020C44BC8|nr:ankyrin repeat domain-containing protein [Anatilimnocola floriformis]
MAKARKKKLPKDFEKLLKTAKLPKLQAVFDDCLIDARGGYSEQTALMMRECSDELARWLVAQGADINAKCRFGRTALHERAFWPQASVKVLIELGCDVNAKSTNGTPLHIAAERGNIDAAKLLLKAGAKIDVKNDYGDTPLEHALQRCQNVNIEEMVPIAQLLLKAGAKKSSKTKTRVEEIGKTFEAYRSNFNPKSLAATDQALRKLYKLFEATPAPTRVKYDGRSPIVAKAKLWNKAHEELWELLVPANGAASTVQGEVIRISGRISGELYRNGGANWDREYRKMANYFLKLMATGKALSDEQIEACRAVIAELPGLDDANLLAEMAVAWVKLNPQPVRLGKVTYAR